MNDLHRKPVTRLSDLLARAERCYPRDFGNANEKFFLRMSTKDTEYGDGTNLNVNHIAAWWLIPVIVVLMLGISLRRASRKAR